MTNKYVQLAKAGTNYARRTTHLANRIFGEVTRPTNAQSQRVVRMFAEQPMYLRPEVINYYPRHVETGLLVRHLRSYGLFRDEHQDFKEEMKRLRALRGKAPPERKKKPAAE